MKDERVLIAMLAIAVLGPATSRAHVSPPVAILPEREAVAQLLPDAKTVSLSEVRLTGPQRHVVWTRWQWRADERAYRVHVGRDASGRAAGAVVVLSAPTLHGPVRAAVGVDAEGRVRDARVLEVTEESLRWVKPLVDEEWGHDYAGRTARDGFAVGARFQSGDRMRRFYAGVLARLVQRGAIVYEVAVLGHAPGD